MKRTIWQMLLLGALVATVSLLLRPSTPASADEPLCFSAPGITNCISAGFRSFWEQAGGLRQFGYPLTPEYREATPDGTYTVQYFERARFEYHPANPLPFQVQLGRLGAELYGPPFRFPEVPQQGCRFFSETGFNVCEPFISAWEKPGSTPGQGSMELYGLPLTPRLAATDDQGNPISVQWFERARFELHGQSLVLFGLLGREKLAQPDVPTTPEPTPTPEPPPLPPTPTLPPPIKAPFPDKPCNVNVPAPVEGLQTWVTLPEVSPPEDEVVCIRLIVDGEPAHPAFGQIFRYAPGGVVPSIMHSTGLDGTTGFIFYVGDLPANTYVPVEAVVTFAGREYRAWTSFVRR